MYADVIAMSRSHSCRMSAQCVYAVSPIVKAIRGITAGSGFAIFEMRLAMIDTVDKALTYFSNVHPTLYVDDLSVEASGEPEEVEYAIGGFGMAICSTLTGKGMEVSPH